MSEGVSFISINGFVVEGVISGDNGGSKAIESSSDHLSNGTEELEFFVSGGGGSFVLSSEGGAHSDRELKKLGVSVDLLVGLGNKRDVYLGVEGYSGLSRLPLDLTLDLGIRFETPAGLFQIAFSNLLGFLP